jgi:hypothetical protein
MALTTGERTATLMTETKSKRRTLAIDASAHATATVPATSRIVRGEMETSTARATVSRVSEETASRGRTSAGAGPAAETSLVESGLTRVTGVCSLS